MDAAGRGQKSKAAVGYLVRSSSLTGTSRVEDSEQVAMFVCRLNVRYASPLVLATKANTWQADRSLQHEV